VKKKKSKKKTPVQKPLPLGATSGGSEHVKKILIRIPIELCDQVDQFKSWTGYKSRNEFIVASIQDHVNRLIRAQKKGGK